ncbi:hypothetical protein D3C72_1535040 [compost metagenome]
MVIQIGGAREHPHATGADGAGVQGGVLQHPDAERHIGAFFDQVDDAFVGVELQLHLGVAFAEPFDQRHQHMQHERRGSVHPQPPGRPHAAGGHLFFGFVHQGQDGPGTLQKGGAFLGEFQPARGAAQQGGLQLLLQPSQGAARGRDRQAEQFGGCRDRPRVHHGRKGLQFIKGGLHC